MLWVLYCNFQHITLAMLTLTCTDDDDKAEVLALTILGRGAGPMLGPGGGLAAWGGARACWVAFTTPLRLLPCPELSPRSQGFGGDARKGGFCEQHAEEGVGGIATFALVQGGRESLRKKEE